MNTAKEKIDLCQDAIGIGYATKSEKSSLTEWHKYRVLLNRGDCSIVPDRGTKVRTGA